MEDAIELQPGHWVRHYGTRMWGKVLSIVPQHDKTLEIEVQGEELPGDSEYDRRPRWWASYHVDKVLTHEPTEADRRSPRPWRPLGGLF